MHVFFHLWVFFLWCDIHMINLRIHLRGHLVRIAFLGWSHDSSSAGFWSHLWLDYLVVRGASSLHISGWCGPFYPWLRWRYFRMESHLTLSFLKLHCLSIDILPVMFFQIVLHSSLVEIVTFLLSKSGWCNIYLWIKNTTFDIFLALYCSELILMLLITFGIIVHLVNSIHWVAVSAHILIHLLTFHINFRLKNILFIVFLVNSSLILSFLLGI